MPNYTKLFNTIISSTIWSENDKTRIVWITMLAIADQNGEVQGSIPGLARLAGVSIEDTEIAIDKFLSPDPYSQTPDYEGRRICKIDGGWELLNHAKYRRMASLADNKDTNAKRQKRHRERNNEVTHERYSNASVTHRNATVTLQTDKAEAEAEAEADNNIPPNPQGGKVKKSKTRKPKNQTVDCNTETMQRINSWFGRRPETKWTIQEKETFDAIDQPERGEAQLEQFYLAEETENEKLHRRTTLSTLLNNWLGELDKARAYAKKH
jgi:hypothetical protein